MGAFNEEQDRELKEDFGGIANATGALVAAIDGHAEAHTRLRMWRYFWRAGLLFWLAYLTWCR